MLSNGNFGGYYERPGPEMLANIGGPVEETRALITTLGADVSIGGETDSSGHAGLGHFEFLQVVLVMWASSSSASTPSAIPSTC